ncbi:MAG: hypothetical protein ABR874_01265 [Candidatus Sulfotelmatobacter sp.]|jgi:hypothetical protein
MASWEYMVYTTSQQGDPYTESDFAEALKGFGEERWELVAVSDLLPYPRQGRKFGNKRDAVFYFKRKKIK